MNSIKLFTQESLASFEREVILPGETEPKTLYLFLVNARRNLLQDLREMMGEEMTEEIEQRARELGFDRTTLFVYGVFTDKELRPVYVFNTLFGIYHKTEKRVIFKELNVMLPGKEPLRIPDKPVYGPAPEKTRSGEITRRILKAAGFHEMAEDMAEPSGEKKPE